MRQPTVPSGNGAETTRVAGLLLELGSAAELARACERVRDAGYTRWDAHSPFPVHGLDRAMGLRRSEGTSSARKPPKLSEFTSPSATSSASASST